MTASSKLFFRSHSDFSFGFGSLTIERLVADVKALGCKQLLLADYDNLHGAVDFYLTAKKHDITPFIGMTCFIEEPQSQGTPRGSITLIAKNYAGFCEIGKVSYQVSSSDNGYIGLEEALLHENVFIVINNAKYLANYANENEHVFYNTIGADGDVGVAVNEEKKVYLPIYSFTKESDFKNSMVLDAIQSKKTGHIYLDKNSKLIFSGEELLKKDLENRGVYFSKNKYEQSENEKNNLDKILEQCEINLQRPKEKIPYKTATEPRLVIIKKVIDFLEKKQQLKNDLKLRDKYFTRVNYELDVLDKAGFCEYFLLVADIVAFAKERGIFVGLGRGSSVGCLIAYCLGITGIDPIRYNLLFQRFMNPERVSQPDIDIDFEASRRGEIFDYIKQKYGRDHVASICVIIRMTAKKAFKDVARVLGVEYKVANSLVSHILDKKDIPKNPEIKIKSAIKYSYENSKELKNAAKNDRLIYHAIHIAIMLENNVSHTGLHPCGIVISNSPLARVLPLMRGETGDLVTQYNAVVLEKQFGLLKIDCLNLKFLDLVREVCENIAEEKISTGEIEKEEKSKFLKDFSEKLFSMEPDDKAVFNSVKNGNTLGVFQFEGEWITDTIKNFKPNNLLDFVAITALCRPGPKKWIPHFIDSRNNGRGAIRCAEDKARYDALVSIGESNKDIKVLLSETEHIPIYEEQIMQIAQLYAGFTLGEADTLRRIISKKKIDEFFSMKQKFLEKAKEEKRGAKEAIFLFDDVIYDFCDYGFNKSHAVAYSFLGYITSFLKVHYHSLFYKALINSKGKDILLGKLGVRLRQEARELNLKIIEPHFSFSAGNTRADKKNIYIGANTIKGIGDKFSDCLNKNFDERECFVPTENSFQVFCDTFLIKKYKEEKVFDAGQIKALISSDYFAGSKINNKLASNELMLELATKKMNGKVDDLYFHNIASSVINTPVI